MYALLLALGYGFVNGSVNDLLRHGVLLRNGVRNKNTAAQRKVVVGSEDFSKLLGAVYPIVHLEAGFAGIERRQLLCLIAENRNSLGFEVFKGESKVKNGFRSGANNHNRGVGKLLQIRGNIHGGFRPSVNASYAAGGENLDSRHVSNHHGGGDGGCAVLPLRAENGQIPAGGLVNGGSLFAEIFYLLRGKSRLEAAADYGYGCGNRAVFADNLFNIQSGFNVLRIGHTVRNNGGFQCNNGFAFLYGLCHFGINIQIAVKIHDKSSFHLI